MLRPPPPSCHQLQETFLWTFITAPPVRPSGHLSNLRLTTFQQEEIKIVDSPMVLGAPGSTVVLCIHLTFFFVANETVKYTFRFDLDEGNNRLISSPRAWSPE